MGGPGKRGSKEPGRCIKKEASKSIRCCGEASQGEASLDLTLEGDKGSRSCFSVRGRQGADRKGWRGCEKV